MGLRHNASPRVITPLIPEIRSSEVHVWWSSLDQDEVRVASYLQVLNARERDRALRIPLVNERTQYIVSQGILRELLSAYTRIPAHILRFDRGSFGKPVLETQVDGEGLSFNVSRSGGVGIYAIGRDRRIGIDIEQMRSIGDCLELAEKFFNMREYRAICEFGDKCDLQFLRYWTCKEAYIKAKGEGLSYLMNGFVVDFSADNKPRIFVDEEDPQACSRWSLYELDLPFDECRGALCAEGIVSRLRIAEWS
ncbi:MAG: 4'-phosphopantetheinyl transferase superfamily protein [Candidatus Thiodiazotropha sp.]